LKGALALTAEEATKLTSHGTRNRLLQISETEGKKDEPAAQSGKRGRQEESPGKSSPEDPGGDKNARL